jgi:acyl-CoA synthetase (NDP forming)
MSRGLAQFLFAPRSVAIVGQSDDAAKTAGRPLKYLRQAGFAGSIYPINPRRQEVLGERAYPSLSALPDVPEHVYIVTPTEAAMDAVAECGKLGVKVATVLANGFAEAGPAGEAREARLRDICDRTGLRVIGPSSLGIADLRSKAMLTANAAFDEPDLPAGRFLVASHSGSMIGALLSRGKARGIGFAGLVSVGNEVDLSLGEICAATLDDPGIDGYMLFLETLRHADALRRFAHAAASAGKPVLAYKLGRSEAARELAVSHTGALASEEDVAEAFLADCGIARVDTLDGLIEGLPLLMCVPPRTSGVRKPAVAVVTTTAGGATMVVDPLASRGVAIQAPGPDTLDRLRVATGIDVAPARIIDLTVAGAQYAAMKAALGVLLDAPEYDLIIAVVGSSARFLPERAVQPIIDCAGSARPIAAFLVPEAPQALAALSAAGVPNFRTPEACADAVAAALGRRAPRALPSWPGNRVRPSAGPAVNLSQPSTSQTGRAPQDVNARRRAGNDEHVGRVLDEFESYQLLDRLGIPRAPAVAVDIGRAPAPSLPFPYPVAVKALAADIPHKTEAGGVELNVRDGDAFPAAVKRIAANVGKRHRHLKRVLVQPMIAGRGEVLVGYRVDRDIGPLIMLAAGGVLAEIYRDRALRLAPVDPATAQEMITEVRGLAALAGYRNRPVGDLDALARTIVALSNLAMSNEAVVEAEINPLMVLAPHQGVVAVDALVRLR